jgi:hypothetical protein
MVMYIKCIDCEMFDCHGTGTACTTANPCAPPAFQARGAQIVSGTFLLLCCGANHVEWSQKFALANWTALKSSNQRALVL